LSRTNPPGPPNSLFGRHHIAAMRRDLVGFGARLQRDYGDVAHFRLGPISCYQFVHPDHVQEVLVRQAKKFRKPARLRQVFGRFEGNGLVLSDGALWARQRRLVQPAFRPDRMQAYAAEIVRLTGQMLDGWGPRAEVDFAAAMTRLALDVGTRTLFSADVGNDVEALGRAVAAVQRWAIRELNRVVATPRWLPLIGRPEARRALAFLDGLVRRIVRERRAAGVRRDDLLGRLLDAVDGEGDGRGMGDRQLRDELVTLLLAGHETTAAALAWAGFLLARHPGVQEPVAAGVRAALGGRPPGFADLPRLAEVEQVFKEALRLYPPIYCFAREVAAPVAVAGYQLRPGSQVFLSPYLTQRDPRWFPEPGRFDPRRFAPGNEARLPACAWFPFGAGPRACVGRGLALLEGTLTLGALLQRCRLEPAPGTGDPEPEWQLSLHPRGGVRLVVRGRDSAPAAQR
jgi:cytochrome P450